MTEAELAGPQGFNCPKLAKLLLPDLECQDHHLPSARAAGIKLCLAAHTGCPHTHCASPSASEALPSRP